MKKNNSKPIYRRLFFVFLMLFNAGFLYSQSVIDDYIRTGLTSNLMLKQKQKDYQMSVFALNQAKANYFPEITVQSRYSIAEGGRSIDLPIGDMLNPVYSTLNELTGQLSTLIPGTNVFPKTSVENQEINFLRPTEHESKLSLRQPLLSSDVFFNYKITRSLSELKKVSVDGYARILVKEIKSSYYMYLKALEYEKLLLESKDLLKENLRVSKKLLEHDKVTLDYLYQAENEIHKLNVQLARAESGKKMAGFYFNFLLNRELEEEIAIEENLLDKFEFKPKELNDALGSSREELLQLSKMVELGDYKMNLFKYRALPELFLALDYGFQGEKLSFSNDDDFVIASVVLRWKLFNGMKEKNKFKEAAIQKSLYQNQLQELSQKIDLQIKRAYYDLQAAYKSLEPSLGALQTCEEVYKIQLKKYKLGQVTFLELSKAENELSVSKTNLLSVKYEILIKEAEFEYVSALFPLNQYMQ